MASVDQPAAYGNPLNAERLKVSIQTNMAARGIQLVDRAQADCVVGYAMGSRQVFDGYYGGYYGAGWGYGYYGRGWRYGGGWGYDGPWVYNETRIAVDLFDAKTHKPIWHASASQNVYELSGPEAVQKIDLATAAIFAKLPVVAPVPAGAAPAGAATTYRKCLSTRGPLHEEVIQRRQDGRHGEHQGKESVQRTGQQFRMPAERFAQPGQYRTP